MAAQTVGVCQINYSVSNENLGMMITFRGRTSTRAVDCALLCFIAIYILFRGNTS